MKPASWLKRVAVLTLLRGNGSATTPMTLPDGMLVHRMQVTSINLPADYLTIWRSSFILLSGESHCEGMNNPVTLNRGLETRPLDPASSPPQTFQASKYEKKNNITENKFVVS